MAPIDCAGQIGSLDGLNLDGLNGGLASTSPWDREEKDFSWACEETEGSAEANE